MAGGAPEHEGTHLELEPERSRRFVEPRVRSGVAMSARPARGLIPHSKPAARDVEVGAMGEWHLEEAPAAEEGYRHAVYEVNLDAVKPRQPTLADFGRAGAPDRFPAAPTGDEALPEEPDHDLERGLAATRRGLAPRAVVDMSRQQRPRFPDPALEAYQEAEYEGRLAAIEALGGRNAKGVRRTTAKGTIDMSRALPRPGLSSPAKDREQQDDAAEEWREGDNADAARLDIDPVPGDTFLRPRQLRGLVAMDAAPPRWAAQDERLARAAREARPPLSPAGLDRAMAALSVGDGSRRTPGVPLDMSKWLGREDEEGGGGGGGAEQPQVEIEPEKGRDAPSQNPRVTGGALDMAKRSGSPKTEHARAVAQQGNVLVLEPNDELLVRRTGLVSLVMGAPPLRSPPHVGEEGQPLAQALPQATVPSSTELDRADALLRPRTVAGGAIELHPPVPKPVLDKRRQAEAAAEREMRSDMRAEANMLRAAELERRRQQVLQARFGKDYKENSRKAAAPRKPPPPRTKEGVQLTRAQPIT
jgi:hypothetical protein